MQTHFHLAVKILDVLSFSKGMQQLKSIYSYKFHAKYKLSGPIWRERYRGLLIEDEVYLYACGQYIENNPVKAALVSRSVDWEYSSSRHHELDVEDIVVDKLYGEEPARKLEVDTQNTEDFENGYAIGSGFFKYEIKKQLTGGRGVPK